MYFLFILKQAAVLLIGKSCLNPFLEPPST